MANELLLLHGALANEKQFSSFVTQLPDHFEPVLFTFPGHHLNDPWDGEFAIASFADALESFLDARDDSPLNVFGYSMGGYVALYLASKRPELFGKIATLGTNFFWTPESAAKQVKQLDADKIAEKVPAFATVLQKNFGEIHWRHVLSRTTGMMAGLGAKDLLPETVLAEIANEVRVLVSENDVMAPIAIAGAAAKALGAHCRVIPNSQHPLEQTDQERLLQELLEFLQ